MGRRLCSRAAPWQCVAFLLFFSSACADRPTPRQLLEAEVRIAITDGDVQIFLHYCDKLAYRCATAKTHLGDTLLHVAAMGGRYQIAKYLVANLGMDPAATGKKGMTPSEKCEMHADNAATTSDNCDPEVWKQVMEEAQAMVIQGEKMDRHSLTEPHRGVDADAVRRAGAGAATRRDEIVEKKRNEKQQKQERLDAYATAQASKPKTDVEKQAAKDQKKRIMAERMAGKKAEKQRKKDEAQREL